MLNRQKYERAKQYIVQGEVPPIWKLLPDSIAPSLSQPSILEPVDDAYVPSWIHHNMREKVVRNTGSPTQEYHTALFPTNDSTTLQLRLEPPREIIGVGFEILNTNHADLINVVAEKWESTGDSQEVVHSSVSNNPDFWQSNAIPVELEFDEPVAKLEISVSFDEFDSPSSSQSIRSKPAVSVPGVHINSDSMPPIFLITVDTFRYDALEYFEPVLDALGSTAIIPKEPRTQGHWTRPSHATMLSGTHPGTHGYVAGISDREHISKVSKDVPFFPEELAESGYRCSACVSQGTIDASFGFGRGFQSYGYKRCDWKTREEDAATTITRSRKWLRQVVTEHDTTNIFYFMHLFDPHYPYLPPEIMKTGDEVDIPEIILFKQKRNAMEDYVTEAKRGGECLNQAAVDKMKTRYHQSIEYTANELALFINYLKRIGIFDNALIIVTGDHGEEFFERGFAQHSTLHDRNIRPGMVIKPPENKNMLIPDNADTIDFAPTICDIAGADKSSDFAGDSWVSENKEHFENRVRLTELITPEWYQVAAQISKLKGIFCWSSSFPDRPEASTILETPEYSEFYMPEIARASPDSARTDPSHEMEEQLLQAARQFAHMKSQSQRDMTLEISDEAESRLEDLGYK